jgi:hypothetical protein
MEKTKLLFAFVNSLAFLMSGTGSAFPQDADPRLLSLVPPGAAIVVGPTPGTPASYLALTRNNSADLGDFLSIAGVDPTRELGRYLARSPVNSSLTEHLSRLRSMGQSWCVLTPTIYNKEIVLRTRATSDPSLNQLHDSNDGLILGIHFGRRVEIEYERVSDSGSLEESQPQTDPEFFVAPLTKAPRPVSSFFSNSQIIPHKVMRLSQSNMTISSHERKSED